jgi:hypothetical protein
MTTQRIGLEAAGRRLLWPAAAVALTGAYCIAYNALAGTPESLADALVWGLLMIAPWVMAVDLARGLRPPHVAAVVGAAFALSLGGEALLARDFDAGFAAIRRVPGAAAAVAAIVGWRAWRRRVEAGEPVADTFNPELVAGYDWIAAAGNYIELHGRPPRRVLRCSLARAERALASEFVRVHRSLLVRRAAIVAHDRGGVRLTCGRRLPVGARYRATLLGD